MARSLPATIGGVTVVDVTLGPGRAIETLDDFWAWVYANYPDLTAANRIVRALASGEILRTTGAISIGGDIVGDATRYVIVTADVGESVSDGSATATPIRYSSSKARFVAVTNPSAIPFSIPDIHCPVVVEALQFRKDVFGDGVLLDAPAGVDLVTRSNIFFDTKSGVSTDCIKYGRTLRSFNDVFLFDCSGSSYPKAFTPVSATTAAHASQIHNPTLLSASANLVGGLGSLGDDAAASGSLVCNALHIGSGNIAFGSNWAATNNASVGSDGYLAGANAVLGIVPADTVESDSSGTLDARLKSTADVALRDGGYDNTADNPVDFFFRTRATSNFNIGAFDPDASSGGDTYNVSLTEAASATDASASVLVAAASIAETATAGDSRSSTQIATRGITEAATATASSSGAMVAGAGVSEAATASDAPGSTIVAGAGVSEVATAIDASGAATQAAAGVSEAATPVDAASAVLVAAASRAELATAADQSTSAAILGAAVTEAATAGDSSTGSIGAQTHDVAITEAASAGVAAAASAVLAASASEGGVAAEDAASTAVMAAAASEAASASESASAAIGASTYNVSATEVASAADSSVADVAIAAHASEGVSAADAAGASAVLVAQAAEAVAADDHASSTLHAVAVLVESVSAADAIVVSADFVRSIVEPAAATDWSEATIGAQTYNVSIVEAAHASDAAVIVAAFGARAPGWRGAVNAGAGRPAAIQTARRPTSRG